MSDSTLTDSLLAGLTTGTVHTATNPTDTNTTIILAIISGIVAPFIKSLIDKWTEKRKQRKANK